ncbi:MAG: TRAP transporter large permease [Betaproteobacteria bacterium]
MTATALGVTALLFCALALGMPVAFALLVSGAVGLWLVGGYHPLMGVLKLGPYEAVASFTLSTIPMFILMAEFLTASAFTRDVFSAAHKWLSHKRGGLAYATVAGGVILAAISGSSSAAAATLSGAAYPEMRRYGYRDSFATGVLAMVGTLAIMIPPSIALVLFGVLTETSVGKLLIAGLLPGALTALGYALVINLVVRLDPEAAPRTQQPFPWRERIEVLATVWPVMLLLVIVVTLIYGGIATPTEVGALGASAALVIAVAMGRIRRADFIQAVLNATRNSAMILLIIAMAVLFGVFLTLTGAPQKLIGAIQAAGIAPGLVLAMILAVLLLLGCFMDQLAILVLTLPLTMPILLAQGYDPVWIGVIYVKTAEIGLVTPPLGLNSFIVSSTTGVPIGRVFRGIWPFVAVDLLILAVLVVYPEISLFLPGLSTAK